MSGYNHHPAYPMVWVDYNGWRFKVEYDIEDKDGNIYMNCYPNGNGFHHSKGRTDDSEVKRLRLSDPHSHHFLTFKEDLSDYVEHALRYINPELLPECILDENGKLVQFK